MRYLKMSFILAVLAALGPAVQPASATDHTWNAGYGEWSDSSNWTPTGPPSGSGDRAFVGYLQAYSQAYLTADASVGYLSLTNNFTGNAWVWTHGQTLTVLGTTILTETSAGRSVALIVDRGTGLDDFDTDILDINGGAELYMDGGIVEIDDQLDVDPNSYIFGYGTIKFFSSNTQALLLAGTLQTDTGTLTLQVTGTGGLDLNGSSGGNSVINVTSGTSSLVVDGPLTDAFNGTMTIGEGNSVDFKQAWTTDGTINFTAGAGVAALIGGQITVNGDINVNSGYAVTNVDTIFNAGANVVIASGASFSKGIMFDTTFNGGNYTGDGTLGGLGTVTVAGDTTIDVAILDWDASASTTINPGVTFTINSTKIDTGNPATDGFDGTVNIDSGALYVNTTGPWRMEGTMNLNYTGGTPTVSGSEMVVRHSGATEGINVTGGEAKIYSPVTFESTASVSVGAGASLALFGTTTYEGGTFTGDGTIRQEANANVTADTTIDVATYDMDGIILPSNRIITIDPGVAFTINSGSIDLSVNGFDGTINVLNGATIAVNTTAPWTLVGTMNLAGGQVTGSEILNEGTISGHGTVTAADLDNNATLSADGGTLVLDTTSFPDLDGTSENGIIEALAGDVHVKGDYGFLFVFDGSLSVGAGREFRMDNRGLWNSGQMYLQGGTYVAPLFAQSSGGTLTVSTATSTLQSDSTFKPGSITTLNADLLIDGAATFEAGATVTGAGTLVILAGSTLDGDGTVVVNVTNQGAFKPGLSAGIFGVGGDYFQTAGGTLEIEIFGLTPGSGHDQLAVNGSTGLTGTLVYFTSGYMPGYYNEFEIITAGAVSGVFDLISGNNIHPDMYLATVYNADNVAAVAAIPGDANLNRTVNDEDLSLLLFNWGSSGMRWTDGDFTGDGVPDDFDLSLLIAHWLWSVPASSASTVPEPASAVLLLSGGVLAMFRRRRK